VHRQHKDELTDKVTISIGKSCPVPDMISCILIKMSCCV